MNDLEKEKQQYRGWCLKIQANEMKDTRYTHVEEIPQWTRILDPIEFQAYYMQRLDRMSGRKYN